MCPDRTLVAVVAGRRWNLPLRAAVACGPRMVSGRCRQVGRRRAARELSCRIHHNRGLIALNVVAAVGYTDVAGGREVRHYFVLHVGR